VAVKVAVNDLAMGMFVAELDRPWLDTPFLMQGFILDNEEDLAHIQRLCKFVLVDPATSTPAAIAKLSIPKPKAEPNAERSRLKTAASPQVIVTGTRPAKKPSLFAGLGRNDDNAAAQDDRTPREPARSGDPIVTYYKDTPNRPTRSVWQKVAATEPSRSAEERQSTDDPIVVNSSTKYVLKRPGLFKQILSTLRSKSHYVQQDQPAEITGGMDGFINKPLIRIAENKVVLEADLLDAKSVHLKSREMIRDVVEDLRRNRPVDIEKINEVINEMVDSVGNNPDALLWLTKLKSRDSYAYDHGIDVAVYMLAFGRHLGYPKDKLHILGVSGLMQDIGKLRVREDILGKSGRLSEEEFEEVKCHVDHSVDILRDTADIPKEVLMVVAQHHERLDGSGYPHRLKGDQIFSFASMAGIVDSFEALISQRPYAEAISTHQALQQLNRWKGTSFHEALTEQFIQCIGIFPVGSLVELNTGDVAVVIGQNKVRRLKPKVMLLLDPDKRPYQYPSTLDLITDPMSNDKMPYQIKRDLPTGAYGIDPQEFYL
jgi:HD-GYP domain-containing protein (c-di-GMP phosphodiesterase class II)